MAARPCDVAVLGGGPAGCAVALSLSSHAPELSVAVVESSAYEAVRVGESLSPIARPLLEHLGVWPAFVAQGQRASYGTTAAWGSPMPHHNEYLFLARGAGWHLDRRAFDALLAAEAEKRGVRLLRGTRWLAVQRAGSGWHLELSSSESLTARFVVDATGAAAAFARARGSRWATVDRLVAFGRLFEGCTGGAADTLVEAFRDGWWYSAALPHDRRIALCMTDADLAARLELRGPRGWRRALEATAFVRADALEGRMLDEPIVRPAHSRRLDPVAGPGWLATGDAASSFDPLSSQGIVKSLRSGIFASYALADALKGRAGALDRYERFIAREFDAFRTTRLDYYGREERWPDGDFWRRRRQDEPGGRSAAPGLERSAHGT